MLLAVVNLNLAWPEIPVAAFIDVAEGLWVAVNQREPSALNLNHQPVSGKERVGYVGQTEPHLCHLAWYKWLRG